MYQVLLFKFRRHLCKGSIILLFCGQCIKNLEVKNVSCIFHQDITIVFHLIFALFSSLKLLFEGDRSNSYALAMVIRGTNQ